MNWEFYRIFLEVAKAGSFSAAARALYITQPAVSQAIAQLENSLGGKLFERSARGVQLTGGGRALLPFVERAVALLQSGEDHYIQLQQLKAGSLRIGASDTLCRYYLLDRLEGFSARYPSVGLHIINRTSQGTVQLLKEGKIDLGFVNMPISAPEVRVHPCLNIHDCWVAGSRYQHLKGQRLTFEQLSQLPLLMLEDTAVTRRMVDAFVQAQGVRLHPQIELSSLDLLSEFARIGLGISCVIREFVDPAMFAQGLFELETAQPLPQRQLGLALPQGPLSAAAEQFIRMLPEGEAILRTV